MAVAFLPWEEWLARLLHPAYIAIRRWQFRRQRAQSLSESQAWPRALGTIQAIHWDSSLPREEIVYSYLTKEGYRSGSHWRWFDSGNAHEVKVGDNIRLCYDPSDTAHSVLLGTMDNSWT